MSRATTSRAPGPLPPCPVCSAPDTRIAEDVSDEVTVLACDACAATWAVRLDQHT